MQYANETFQWSENTREKTLNTTLYFPIGFNTALTLISVGFLIVASGRQMVTFTSTYLSTSSDLYNSATDSYLALGI
ncbi:MAG: hypothetical protein SPF22_07790 [Candidatus Onthovivens sp.]|nr:hypothetical protein [Candidatus Onthovivens sp.]